MPSASINKPRRKPGDWGGTVEEREAQLNLLRDIDVRRLVLNIIGTRADLRVEDSIIDGEVVRTMRGPSNVSITIHDQDRSILRSQRLDDPDGRLRALDVLLDGMWFRTADLDKQGDDLVLTLIDRQVARLQDKKGPRKAASRAKVTRAQYVLALVRAVKAWKGEFEIPELRKKQPVKKLTKKQREAARDRRRSKGFDRGVALQGKEGLLNKTELDNASRVLAICDDLNAGELATLAVLVACIVEAPDFRNPSGGEGSSVGILQLTKRHYGGSIPKRRDIERVITQFLKGPAFTGGPDGAIALARKHPTWTPGRIAQTIQGSGYPGRYDKYRSQARAILREWGGTALKASRFSSYEFRVEKKENYWDAIQRLAKEVNWAAFFSGDVFYFMSEEDLFAQRAKYRVSEDTPGVSNIDFRQSYRKKTDTCTISCRIDRWEAAPGTVVIVTGVGPANGRYLVEEIRRNLFSPEAEIKLVKPAKERKEPRPEILPQGEGAVGPDTSGAEGVLTTEGGAKGIADQLVTIAQSAGGAGVYVGSDLRDHDRLPSGNFSDHADNDTMRAARDIGVRGINLLTGPPSPKLDKAIMAIGRALGTDYESGKSGPFQNADNIQWRGYRIQLIWRTPKWGGHMGHIHVGVRSNKISANEESDGRGSWPTAGPNA